MISTIVLAKQRNNLRNDLDRCRANTIPPPIIPPVPTDTIDTTASIDPTTPTDATAITDTTASTESIPTTETAPATDSTAVTEPVVPTGVPTPPGPDPTSPPPATVNSENSRKYKKLNSERFVRLLKQIPGI